MPPKAMASSTNSYWAIGIVTREGDKHGAVTMAFARSNRDFKLLPRHRERAQHRPLRLPRLLPTAATADERDEEPAGRARRPPARVVAMPLVTVMTDDTVAIEALKSLFGAKPAVPKL